MTGRYLTFTWFHDWRYFVVGWNGRPWALTLQVSFWDYANLDMAAPILGDVRLGIQGRRWRAHYLTQDKRRLIAYRASWAEIDRTEEANRQHDIQRQAFRRTR